jgi:hypothetical protein
VCFAVFLDIAQVFDKVWHRGLLHKLRSTLPNNFYLQLKSYLANRYFRVKHEDSYSELKLFRAGVEQRSVLGPVLYLLYINDVPTTSNSTMATFADDTAVMALGETLKVQRENCTQLSTKSLSGQKKWRIISTNPDRYILISQTRRLDKKQSSSIIHKSICQHS